MSDASRQQSSFQPQPPILPAQNGRTWVGGVFRIISEHFGPLLGLIALGGGLLYGAFSVIVIVLGMMGKQQTAHLQQTQKVMDLILVEVGNEQRNIWKRLDTLVAKVESESVLIQGSAKSIIEIRTIVIEMRERQQNFVPVLNRLLGIGAEINQPTTVPPGRERPPFTGTGPQ